MANFNEAYKIVKANEGGYSNNPADRGGETYKGIARKRWPEWAGWGMIDSVKRTAGANFPRVLATDTVLQKLVLDFYKVNFWNVLRLDEVKDQAIATELFDTGVNMGTGPAAEFLQRALNLTNRRGQDYADLPITSNVGPKTLAAVNGHKAPALILKILNVLQGTRYVLILEGDDTQEIFTHGWFNRVAI